MQKQSGFKLIEVMVEIFLIAILAVIAIAQFSENRIRARLTDSYCIKGPTIVQCHFKV